MAVGGGKSGEDSSAVEGIVVEVEIEVPVSRGEISLEIQAVDSCNHVVLYAQGVISLTSTEFKRAAKTLDRAVGCPIPAINSTHRMIEG